MQKADYRSKVSGLIKRFVHLLKEERSGGMPRHDSPQQQNMSRVTDMAGNEYLCPVSELKEESFVHEDEKSKCFDYNQISKSSVI